MTDYFDRIEGHLLDAVGRQVDRRSGPRLRAAARSGVAAASVLLVALVFLGALLVLGGGGHQQSSLGAGAAPSRAVLIRLLGVLRRTQTPAGRAFEHTGWPTPPRAPGSQIEPDRALIRLATVTPWGANTFIVPLRPPASRTLARAIGETVALWVQGIGWSDYSSAADIQDGQAWGPSASAHTPRGLESRFFEIVPDGVASVTFYLLRQFPRPGEPPRFSRAVTANVHDNVAVFELKVTSPGAYPVYAVWRSASGRRIRTVGNFGGTLQAPFPLAPHTQSGAWAGTGGPCPLAAPNPYLPRRSGCVSEAIADVDGDGRPDLVVLYAQLTSHRVGGWFLPAAFTLRVARAGGSALSAHLPHPISNPSIILVRNVNDRAGAEIFVQDGCISSGCSAGTYTFDGRGLRVAGSFTYGGDSAQQYGFTCQRGARATITQHRFLLQTGGANALWQQTDTIFTWFGAKLKRTSQHGSLRHWSAREIGGLGFPPKSLTSISC